MLGELVKLRFIFIGLTHTHPNLHHVGSFKIYIIFAINLDGIGFRLRVHQLAQI